MREGYPADGDEQQCECVADNGVLEIGGQRYRMTLSGFMQVRAGEAFLEDDRATVPLKITGHETAGTVEGLGAFSLHHDDSRRLRDSRLQELSPEDGFPAAQEMHVNVKMTLERFPGMTLRNVVPATLRNSDQGSWPPSNARYDLQAPMNLENADEPGTVVARIVSYTARINPAAG